METVSGLADCMVLQELCGISINMASTPTDGAEKPKENEMDTGGS